MNELKPCPCPICGAVLKIHGPEDWNPAFYDPDSGGDPYEAWCDCGFRYCNGSYDYAEFMDGLNHRAQPENEPPMQRELWPRELPAMNNKCVWVQFPELGMPALVAFHADEDDGDKIYLTNNLGGRSTVEEVIEQGGVIYRRKPEEVHNEQT